MVTVKQELDYVERYINLQKMRFGSEDELVVHAGADVLRLSIPKMCLQPLVENTITHGGLFRNLDSRLQIDIWKEEEWLCISVRDNGVPISKETAEEIGKRLAGVRNSVIFRGAMDAKNYYTEASGGLMESSRGGMVGVANVYHRLLLVFSEVHMSLAANDWGGTTVSIRICLKQQGEKAGETE